MTLDDLKSGFKDLPHNQKQAFLAFVQKSFVSDDDARHTDEETLSQAQKTELDRRLALYKSGGMTFVSLDKSLAKILSKHGH